MDHEDYKELSECLIFLQLNLMDREEKLSAEGFATLMNLSFAGWNVGKTDEVIKQFIRKYSECGDDNYE